VTLQRSRRFLSKASDHKRAYRSLMAGARPDAVAAYAGVESCAGSPRRTAVLLTRTTCLLRAHNLLVLSMLVAQTSSLDTDLTRSTRAPHFTPQHQLLCHMGLY